MLIQTPALITLPPMTPTTDSASVTPLMDASGEKYAGIIVAPKTGNISTLVVRTGTVTASDPLKVSIQGIDANGDPDGSIKASGNAYGTIATPASTTTYTITLTGVCAVTKGERMFVVFEFNPYTDGNLTIYAHSINLQPSNNIYGDLYTASWAKNTTWLFCGVQYDDGTVLETPGGIPAVVASTNVNTTTTPDEMGNLMILPFACRIVGIWATLDMDYNVDLKYYGPPANDSISLNAAERQYTSRQYYMGFFNTPKIVQKNDRIRVSVCPTTSSSVSAHTIGTIPTGFWNAFPMGNKCMYTARTDAGAWSETDLKRTNMGIVIDQIDDGNKPWRMRGSYGRRG